MKKSIMIIALFVLGLGLTNCSTEVDKEIESKASFEENAKVLAATPANARTENTPNPPTNLYIAPPVYVEASHKYIVTLSWAHSSSLNRDYYLVYRNGSYIGASYGTSYVDNYAYPGNTYEYKLRTIDTEGDVSAYSSVKTVTLPCAGSNVSPNLNSVVTRNSPTTLTVKMDTRVTGEVMDIIWRYKVRITYLGSGNPIWGATLDGQTMTNGGGYVESVYLYPGYSDCNYTTKTKDYTLTFTGAPLTWASSESFKVEMIGVSGIHHAIGAKTITVNK